MKKLYALLLLISCNVFAQQVSLNSQYTLGECETSTDGFATFDLNSEGSAILAQASLDASLFTAAFYLDTAALNANTPLPGIYANSVASHQVLLVKVWENTLPSNSATSNVHLYVENAAIAYPVMIPIIECDYDGPNDGFNSFFDLTPAGAEALGMQSPAGYSIAYYTSEAAANAGDTTSPDYITSPTNFTNMVALGQTIWIRVTNTASVSGCFAVTPLTLQVTLLPEPVIISFNQYVCQDFITGEVQTSVTLSVDAVAGDMVTWYRNGEDVTINNTAHQFVATVAGTYTAVVTSGTAAACTSHPSNASEVFRSGPAVILGNTGFTYEDGTLTILTTGYGTYEYALSSEGPWQESNVFTNVEPGTYTIYVKDLNGCDTLLILIDTTLAVQNADFSNLRAYPNPVIDVLTVSGSTEITAIEIYNALGQLVLAKNTLGKEAAIATQGLQNGMYMVKVIGENATSLLKVIKK